MTPRGVFTLLRSVRLGTCTFAHFTGIHMLQRGCLLCLFFAEAVVGPNIEQADVKHHVFCM